MTTPTLPQVGDRLRHREIRDCYAEVKADPQSPTGAHLQHLPDGTTLVYLDLGGEQQWMDLYYWHTAGGAS